MRWMDLRRHGLSLTIGKGCGAAEAEPHLLVRGAIEHHAADLAALGFEPVDSDSWRRPGAQVPQSFWLEARSRFPLAKAIEMPIDALFDAHEQAALPDAPSSAAATRAKQVSYTKVGENRGRKRLWLEGMRLEAAGFKPGDRFALTLDLHSRRIILTASAEGDRQVSSRTTKAGARTPIIDVCDASIERVLGPAGRVRAAIYEGRIEFDLHPVDHAVAEREARTRANVEAGRITEAVLCAGGGVSALALKQGFAEVAIESSVEWVVDREVRYLQAAADNNPALVNTRLFEASLEELEATFVTPVDVMQVSLPCTGHSVAGKAKRKIEHAEQHPTDALAVYGALKLIEASQPSVVVMENVAQAATSATYALIRAYLQEQAYAIAETVLDGQHAGTLEHRSRHWLVAISRGFAKGFDLEALPPRPRQHQRLGEVLEALPADAPAWKAYEYLDAKAERDAADGKGFARQLVTPDSEKVGTIGRGYAKQRSTEPFLVREDGLQRILTPTEHARVKGIPEELVRDLSQVLAHEILGQSILFPHAQALAAHIGAHLKRSVGVAPAAQVAEAVDPEAGKAARSAPGM